MIIKLSISLVAAFLLPAPAAACDNEQHNHLRSQDEHHHHHKDRNLQGPPPFVLESIAFPSQAAFIDSGARCASRDLTPSEQAKERAAVAEYRARNPEGTGPRHLLSTVNVETVFNVIHDDSLGLLSDSSVTAQMNVLNDAFAASGFAFNLRETNYYNNAAWFTGCYTNQNFKTSIRLELDPNDTGDYMDVLYVYTCAPSNGILGYAYYPSQETGRLDGVVLLHSSLPGGSAYPYNLGDTATHEVRNCSMCDLLSL